MSVNVNNSNVLNVFKVCDEINGRLFIHKPFIEGEIRFMIKHFEEIRNDHEINQLFQTLERITDFKETQIDFAFKQFSIFDKINNSVDSVDNLMKEILSFESNQEFNRKCILNDKRDEKSQEMSQFVDLMKSQINEIDASFEEKENNLRQYYKDLEIKLKISPNH